MTGIRDIEWTPSATEVAALLRRLQGSGGYADTSTALRDLVLRGWATALAAADAKIVDAHLEGLPSTTTEEVETWERIYGLPNDAARTLAERRDRLVAVERSYGGGTQAAIDAALDTVTAGANTTIRKAIGTSGDDGASALAELTTKIGLADSAFDDPAIRRAIAAIVRRMMPARSIGEIDLADPLLNVSGSTGLAWHSTTKKLDRDTIDATTGVSTVTAKSRIRDFGPLSIVRARDLNRIQAESLWSHLQGANTRNVSTAGVGQVVRYVEISAANGATVTLDSSVDWRDRYVHLYLVRSTSDIRPGAGSDGSYGTSSTVYVGGIDTGAGTTTATGLNMSFSASGSGALQVTNSTGSTFYMCGIVVGLPPFYEGRVDDELASPFYDGASAGRLSKSFVDRLLACRMKPAAGLSDPVDSDSVERYALVPNIRTTNARTHYVIDSSIDWRDRVIALRPTVTLGAGSYVASAYPGANDGNLTIPLTGGVFYSRDGETPGTVSATSNVASIGSGVSATLLVYADASTGALTLTHIPDGDEGSYPWSSYLLQLFVQATGRFGLTAYGPSPWAGTITDANAVRSFELNRIQDLLVPSQVTAGPGTSIDAFPLGRIGQGWPRIPRTFVDRDGNERRQNVAGVVRRVFGATLASASSTVIDTSIDWRDRIVTSFGAANVNPIYRDGANRSSIGELVRWGGYFRKEGTVWNYGVLLGTAASGYQLLFARESDGALLAVNTAASGVHIVATIEASPKLGPMTPAGVRDRDFSKPYPTGTMLGDPDLILWWDAGLGPIRAYGGGVDSWIDRSLGGIDGSRPSSGRPAWSATSFDSSPGVTFSGSATERINGDPTSAFASTTGITVVAFLQDSTSSASAPFDIAAARANGAGRVFVDVNGTPGAGTIAVTIARGVGSSEVWSASASLASPTCFAFAINGMEGASPIEGIRINGSPSGSRYSITDTTTTTSFGSSTKLTIGCNADGGGAWAGTLAQIAIFRRLLTGAEVAKVEAEMKGSKYPSITLGGSTSWT